LHTVNLLLPTSLLHARDLTFASKFSEADTADTIFAKISVRTAADFTSVVASG